MKKSTLTENKAEQTPTGGVLVGKREGQTIIHNKGTLSGYLVGKTHAEGGIQAVNKSTGQPLEMQGGEVVITAPAVSDNTKREFEGKMMTNREILSAINEKGGGVAFADGGDVPKSIKHTGASYKYGGKTMTDHEIMMKINGGHLAEGYSLREIASIHQVPISDLKKQVRLGMEAESEHTPSKREQMKIVKDHLFENPKYYTLLKKAGLEDGGDLISVNVVESKNQKNSFGDKRFDIKSNNKIVGHIVVGSRWYHEKSTKPDYYEVVNSSVKDQNKGIGTKAYIKLINILDKPLHSDMVRTPQAEKVWQKLEKMNLAKKSKDNIVYESFKKGGEVENLVKDAKSGNTPARDLNNYNDVMDLQADNMVGADTGLYANGGELKQKGFIDEELDQDLKAVYQNRAYKNLGGSDFYFSRLNVYPLQNVFTIELPNGTEIGRATLNEKGNYLTNIRVNENYRRKGLASNLYDYIEYVIGKKLKPSPDKISKEAQSLWTKRNSNITFANGGLIAPNGNPSNLTLEQYKLVRTPEFKAWFGDWENEPENASKVVDENGEPMVCYHATDNKFWEFKKEKQVVGYYGKGFYFSNSLYKAKQYGKRVIPAFLNIKSVFELSEETPQELLNKLAETNVDVVDMRIENDIEQRSKYTFGYVSENADIFMNNLIKNGYLGIRMIYDLESKTYFYIVFDSNQIKLADGTNTTFDGNNPDIRYATGGDVKPYDANMEGDSVYLIKEENISEEDINETIETLEILYDSATRIEKKEIKEAIEVLKML